MIKLIVCSSLTFLKLYLPKGSDKDEINSAFLNISDANASNNATQEILIVGFQASNRDFKCRKQCSTASLVANLSKCPKYDLKRDAHDANRNKHAMKYRIC